MNHRAEPSSADAMPRWQELGRTRDDGQPWATTLLCLVLILCVQSCGNGQVKQLRLGDPAPAFIGVDLSGAAFSLAAHRGNPVVIRFFLTDCPYCRADTPAFNVYYRQHKDAGLTMVYINSKDPAPETSRRFAEELDIPFPVMVDQDGEIARRYRVKAMPQTIILSPEHRIIAAIGGGVSEAELQEVLEAYLDGH